MGKQYYRDKRSPQPKNETVSRVMSTIKAKNTGPERLVQNGLKELGIRNFKLHYDRIPGKPDIAFIKAKIAVFIHGCYWHRCHYCKYCIPKTNTAFWQNKFLSNKIRDRKKKKDLHEIKWTVITLWECQIRKNLDKQIGKITKVLYG
jgi:DNA mismatch endonuclease (patch repair protein)